MFLASLTLIGVVVMMYVQVPSPYVRYVDVKAFQADHLSLPESLDAGGILVPHWDLCINDAIDLLVVHVPLVPGEGEAQVRVSLEVPLENDPADPDHEVNPKSNWIHFKHQDLNPLPCILLVWGL